MTDSFQIIYSPAAISDMKGIYSISRTARSGSSVYSMAEEILKRS